MERADQPSRDQQKNTLGAGRGNASADSSPVRKQAASVEMRSVATRQTLRLSMCTQGPQSLLGKRAC